MRYNPFVMQYRKQPTKRLRYSVENPTKTLVNGMVTLGSIAVLGHTVVGVANAFQKG